jgi:hypothetical protein
MQMSANVIFAHLEGSRTCSALGITIFGSAPVLKLCRALVAAGHDPDARLEVFRRGKLALIVKSLGDGAVLRVTERRDGRPIFASQSDAGSPQSALSHREHQSYVTAQSAA